ncbi:unnamed protein product [Callosobruchus maculatus]|uniref:Eye-specific diacylglycerol kinase n=1 Tax=Callosobruchus maculatus TaxID=64391 RepID=A0A653BRX3_CALMS|nr:unnamed protein product [Callosobruchus maculatus]
MQRLRTTFKRSRTPTASEMKTHSSLEVPKQVRSASFDEIQLKAKRLQEARQSSSDEYSSFLGLPPQGFPDQRSKSVDSGASEELGTYLDVNVKKFQRRRSSTRALPVCVHCVYLEEYKKQQSKRDVLQPFSFSISESSSDGEPDEEPTIPECPIRVTLTPEHSAEQNNSPPPVHIEPPTEFPETPTRARRKSIHRQQAFIREPTESSLENLLDVPSPEIFSDETSDGTVSEGDLINVTRELDVKDIYLQVPDLKRDRAVSVDSCFLNVTQNKTEEIQHSGNCLEIPVGPNVQLRSGSVDVVFPTDEQARYKALAMATPPGSRYPLR